MTAPLDEKGLELAAREIAANDWSVDSNMTKREWQDARWIYHRDDAEVAIRAYIAAAPSPSEMEVVAKLRGRLADYDFDLAQTIAAGIVLDRAAYGEDVPGITYAEVKNAADALDQAQSALAAMRAERDEAKENVSALRGLLEYSEASIARLQSKWQFQLERAETAEAQVLRLTEEIEALRKDAEPELSCPHLDAFISATNPPAEVIEEIETARNINSQLRYGLWHEKARAEAAEARIKALEEALRPFANEADQWEGFEDSEALVEGWNGGPASSVNVGSLRSARSALKENAL